VRKLARVIAMVGVVAASTFVASASKADHVIVFTDCSSSQAQSSSSPEPTFTPPPTEEPGGQEPQATPSPQDCVPPEGDRIWGDRLLRFEIEDNGYNIKDVKLLILSQEEDIPSANGGKPVATWTPDNDQRTFGYDWDSVADTPYNGRYKVAVDSTAAAPFTGHQHQASRERIDLRVDNPPKPVAAPKILATTISSVTISWPKATEVDVLSYTIYRATTPESAKSVKTPPYSEFRQVGVTATQSFRDSTVKPGTQWYSVRVTRRSVVTPEVGVSSALSPVSKPATVESPQVVQKKSEGGKVPPRRYIPFRQLAPPRPRSISAQVPDAPFAYKLPYGKGGAALGSGAEVGSGEPGAGDPRGPVLPVAVGMFLVSSALAVGRMPY
jgi:hypothetical protein